ncbi:ABC transporter substrate-binding protein [Nonomuraea jiangxiensis]|uniref:Peptide/nickel transport system substrate-binding protein n=1 Tax=Nonomuraea jiangxiensis TaxID=633440 RepID=A0A1G9JIG4_9ACTN|nr:ABC transporter substrate-binding protein [Nonomuraea jiangxiensis]SDL37082.1 peptide/nickel transport system substrate-binding protein [Nonomuraea jiangxiensis]
MNRLSGALAVVLLGLAIGCSDPTNTPARVSPHDAINVYLYQKPKRFSPLDPPSGPDQQVMTLIFDNLLAVDDSYTFVPRLAERWEVAEDRITFHLRQGLKWSDGTPFTSRDVLFTYKLLADAESGSALAGRLAGAAFEAPDDTTFVIRPARPNVGFLSLVARPYAFILPEHVLGREPVDRIASSAFFNHPTVGLGPYTFVSYRTDQYVELAANPHYRKPVSIARIFLKPISSDVATAQLGTGEMDLAQISPTDLRTVAAFKGVTVAARPSPGFIRMAADLSDKRFADPRIRRAMLHAIDRKALVAQLLAGRGRVQNSSFVTPWALPGTLEEYAYDPARARSLLAEAGWNPAEKVTLSWIPGQRDRDAAATVVQSALGAAGMTVELKQVQAAELLESYEKRTFDLALYGGGSYAADPSSSATTINCAAFYPTGSNVSNYCDPSLDTLTAQADALTDREQRAKLYQEAARRDNAQVPYLWLYNPDTLWATSSRLRGFKPSGDFTTGFWNADEWTVAG